VQVVAVEAAFLAMVDSCLAQAVLAVVALE
jgi:hypothetical protein